MTDLSNLVPVIAWWFMEDATIYAKVLQTDGTPAIIPGFQITLSDSYLDAATNPKQTCIGIHEVDCNNAVYAFYQTNTAVKSSQLLEVNVLSKVSEATARELAAIIDAKLQADMLVTYDGSSYHFMVRNVDRRPMYDQAGKFWRQAMTVRGEIYY
jgi:hypothetical protein